MASPCGFPSPSCSGAYIRACRPCGLRSQGLLWITGFALWITMLRICGLVECGGWLRPHTPQAGLSPARHASCGCSSGVHGGCGGEGREGGQTMQGDAAPCGTTDRDAAAPHLLPHAGSAFAVLFRVFRVFRGFSPHAVLFRVFRVFRGLLHAGSPARSAF